MANLKSELFSLTITFIYTECYSAYCKIIYACLLLHSIIDRAYVHSQLHSKQIMFSRRCIRHTVSLFVCFLKNKFVYFDVKQDQFLFGLWWSIQLCCCTPEIFSIDTLYLPHSHTNKPSQSICMP